MASKEWRALPAALILAATTALADPPALLRAPDPVQLDLLGSAVAATPDLIVTSYPSRAPALKGKLFTFVHGGSGWSQESTFITDWYGDGLGLAVAVQGDLLVVGAPMRRNAANDAIAMRGRVHFLRRSAQGSLNEIGWYSGALAAEQIGFSVALDGGTAIIGAPGGPIGPWADYEGFYANQSVDDTRTSVHAFTRGGILGRDVIKPID